MGEHGHPRQRCSRSSTYACYQVPTRSSQTRVSGSRREDPRRRRRRRHESPLKTGAPASRLYLFAFISPFVVVIIIDVHACYDNTNHSSSRFTSHRRRSASHVCAHRYPTPQFKTAQGGCPAETQDERPGLISVTRGQPRIISIGESDNNSLPMIHVTNYCILNIRYPKSILSVMTRPDNQNSVEGGYTFLVMLGLHDMATADYPAPAANKRSSHS